MKLDQAITEELTLSGLSDGPHWRRKVVLLYQAHLASKCVVLVGDPGSGKTTACNVLRSALAAVLSQPHEEVRVNPWALSAAEMFGEAPAGLLPLVLQHLRTPTAPGPNGVGASQWLVLDGPFHDQALPYLQAVLEPVNAGAEPLLAATSSLWLEVDTLGDASPALVTRAHMVAFSQEALGWAACFSHLFNSYQVWKGELLVSTGVACHFPASCAERHKRLAPERAKWVGVRLAVIESGSWQHLSSQSCVAFVPLPG